MATNRIPEQPARAWLRIANPALAHLWDAARPYYRTRATTRRYHNEAHANQVASALFQINDAPTAGLLLAARWHDAVYVPGAPVGLNESCSAQALTCAAAYIQCDSTVAQAVQVACWLVRNTHIGYHTRRTSIRLTCERTTALAQLLDADLHSLASPWPRFKALQHHIVRERLGPEGYATEGLRESALRSASRWLHSEILMARRHVYHTPQAREWWEEHARANILRWYNHNQDQDKRGSAVGWDD